MRVTRQRAREIGLEALKAGQPVRAEGESDALAFLGWYTPTGKEEAPEGERVARCINNQKQFRFIREGRLRW